MFSSAYLNNQVKLVEKVLAKNLATKQYKYNDELVCCKHVATFCHYEIAKLVTKRHFLS